MTDDKFTWFIFSSGVGIPSTINGGNSNWCSALLSCLEGTFSCNILSRSWKINPWQFFTCCKKNEVVYIKAFCFSELIWVKAVKKIHQIYNLLKVKICKNEANHIRQKKQKQTCRLLTRTYYGTRASLARSLNTRPSDGSFLVTCLLMCSSKA